MNLSPLALAKFPSLPLVKGVTFASVAAGVKYPDRNDVMLVSLCDGTAVAGVFTTSSTRSSNVRDCQDKMAQMSAGPAAILVNSGNSNAFTGRRGDGSVQALCEGVSEVFPVAPSRVFTASTGVIGEPLPHEKIIAVLDQLQQGQDEREIEQAARAIMTTDTFAKGAGRVLDIDGQTVNIAGIAKGSGMIAPDMATMLVFIFTDAILPQSQLQAMLSAQTECTFNCITVDGDTSTSDTLILAATGASGIDVAGHDQFEQALHDVMLDLAQQVVRDGEGASKFIEVQVRGAQSKGDAKKVAMSIANSPLVKTALAGEDPNWGRIVMAVGKSGAHADRDLLSIHFGDILVAEHGWVAPSYREEAGAAYMTQQELVIAVDLGLGAETCTVWTCDLTHGYISINADYRS